MSVDLRTKYLGLELRSPIVASASPLTGDPDVGSPARGGRRGRHRPAFALRGGDRQRGDRPQLARSRRGAGQFAEALDYFPAVDAIPNVGERYLARLTAIKAQSAVPVIASLNALDERRLGPLRHASCRTPAPTRWSSTSTASPPTRSKTAAEMDAADLDLIAAVRAAITIPLAVKLSPYYSAFANFARGAVERGADGLVLFNRFYQPDLDLESLEVVSKVELSSSADLRLPLRWIAILRPQLGAGPCRWRPAPAFTPAADVAKELLVGADVAMMTSALLRNGPEHVRDRRDRAASLDGRVRVRVGRPASRQREPGDGGEPLGVRASQLRQGPSVVGGPAIALPRSPQSSWYGGPRPPLDLETIYGECFPRVYGFALRMLGDRETALEIAQDTFANAVARADSFRGESAPLTWLLSIARNLCLRKLSVARSRRFRGLRGAHRSVRSRTLARALGLRAPFLRRRGQGGLPCRPAPVPASDSALRVRAAPADRASDRRRGNHHGQERKLDSDTPVATAVGFSVWEAGDRDRFDAIFSGWKPYYSESEVRVLITPAEAMMRLAR